MRSYCWCSRIGHTDASFHVAIACRKHSSATSGLRKPVDRPEDADAGRAFFFVCLGTVLGRLCSLSHGRLDPGAALAIREVTYMIARPPQTALVRRTIPPDSAPDADASPLRFPSRATQPPPGSGRRNDRHLLACICTADGPRPGSQIYPTPLVQMAIRRSARAVKSATSSTSTTSAFLTASRQKTSRSKASTRLDTFLHCVAGLIASGWL